MKKNDFDPPICLFIAKLTVEINFQTIKKKKSEKQNANYCTKGRKKYRRRKHSKQNYKNNTATKM